MGPNKDYTGMTFLLTVTVIVILIGMAFIPPFRVGGMTIKRANILSDIIGFDDIAFSAKTSEDLLDTSFLDMLMSHPDAGRIFAESDRRHDAEISTAGQTDDGAKSGSLSKPPADSVRYAHIIRPVVNDDEIVNIEDFSPGGGMMSRFYHSLAYQSSLRPIRIAVLGDSFIEGDIITADMREQLQLRYGGSGVGFVPFSTPLSKYRGTIRHEHQGWETYNVVKIKEVPEEYKPWFFVSGNISVPKEGAATEYKGVKFRNYIESTNTAALLFVNRGNSSLDITVNDSGTTRHRPPSGDDVAYIRIGQPDISNIKIKVTDAKGFIGYGVVLEDSVGVSVHNFSVRSNSGMALFATDYRINRRINELMNYDLVILQYGLNAMSPDVTNYSYYGRQMCRIIEYIKECFPGSAILVMSVGDRSTLKGGTATTMPAVEAMIKTQRDAAEKTGIAFWNTFEAMGGKNSMPKFVERKWAAKDHTHIGYTGGKYIAERFVAYLDAAAESVRRQNDTFIQPVDSILRKNGASLPGMINVPTPETVKMCSENMLGNKRLAIEGLKCGNDDSPEDPSENPADNTPTVPNDITGQ